MSEKVEKVHISESEWKVMEVLWKAPESSLSQITEALKDSNWSYSTIKTLIGRLVTKGYILVKKEGKNFRYSASVEEGSCKAEETKGFLSRVFGGSVSALVLNLAEESALTEKEQQELISLIESMGKKGGR